MKYLFVDTNNFIGCALLIEPKHSPETIKKLSELLDSDKAKLFLPEVVEIEFFRVVDTELSTIEKVVNNFKKNIDDNLPTYLGTEKNGFINSAESIFEKRKNSSEVAKKEIKKIFESKKTIKIPITFEIFINAYKRALAGKKPYEYKRCPECKELKNIIDADCIIFESIISKCAEIEEIELVFSSRNKDHFASFDDSNNKHILHPDLESTLPKGTSVKYHLTLVEALNSEFQTEIDEIEAKKIDNNLNAFKNWTTLTEERLATQNVLNKLLSEKYPDLISRYKSPLDDLLKRSHPIEEALKASKLSLEAIKASKLSLIDDLFKRSSPIEEAINASKLSLEAIKASKLSLIDDLLKRSHPIEEALKTSSPQIEEEKKPDTSESKEEQNKKDKSKKN